MVVKDIMSVIKCNDVRIVSDGEEIALFRYNENGYLPDWILSPLISNMVIDHIDTDECIPNTINIYIRRNDV